MPHNGESKNGPPASDSLRSQVGPLKDDVGDNQGDLDIIKSPNDTKQYRYIVLDNGLRVLLISDWEALKRGYTAMQPSAAMCVGVGTFSDPTDLPGLAHFLEHMVFLGNEKYPSTNDLDAFLKKHGGSSYAFTEREMTIFVFHVKKKCFKEALDRWAQFFICPLLVQETIDREVEVLDSEYQQKKPYDSNRKHMLLASLAKPGYPIGKFSWGNAQTLKHDPNKKKINVYNRLRAFWKRHYSAHYMTLAVQSNEKLDTLEKWVREIFSKVPNNGLPKPDFSDMLDPFDTPSFNKLYRVVPVQNVHSLNITWALPRQEKHYRVKPLYYISWLINSKGPGSILSVLKRKCWALNLQGHNNESGSNQNTTYSIFCIVITLTTEGFKNFYQVSNIVFQYLKMLQIHGPDKSIYEEIQMIEEYKFAVLDEHFEKTCVKMQLYPKEDLLTGNRLMFDFSHEVIGAALSLLTPEKANLMLLSPEHEGRCPLREKWFGAQYSVEDIQPEWMRHWMGNSELNNEIFLPAKNTLFANEFTLKPSDCPDSEFPVRMADSERGCLWYKKDTTFIAVIDYIIFHLISPIIQQSAKSAVLLDLLVNILNHNLAEPSYEAKVALLEYSIVAGMHGVVITVSGYQDKLPMLFRMIIDHLADFKAPPEVFGMIAEQLKKTYFNYLIRPANLSEDVRLVILQQGRWSVVEKYQVLAGGLSAGELMDFGRQLKAEMYAEGLVQGNFSSNESRGFLQYVIDKLQFSKLQAEVPVMFPVVELPRKHHVCKVKSFNKGDANSEVTVYYQSGSKDLKVYVLVELLVMFMKEPCHHFLRTKETLGYTVYPTLRNTSGVVGFSITVRTQATKFSTEQVELKIEEFLNWFGEMLSAMTQEAFNTQVNTLLKQKESWDSYLSDEVYRNWSKVVTKQYMFDRRNKEAEALKKITQGELLSWYYDQRGPNSRKLSVHVVGFGVEEGDHPNDETPGEVSGGSVYGDVSRLTFLAPSPKMSGATPIMNINAFIAGLPLLP
nr:nardilysin-like [Nerophis lumbriciformis]